MGLSERITLVVEAIAGAINSVRSVAENALDIANAAVPSTRTVAGKALSSNISITKGDVGLGNVDNTTDAGKPISTATQTALNAKVGSPNASISGLEYYASVEDLPSTGIAGVIYFVDSD